MATTAANKQLRNPALEVGVFDAVEDARRAVQRLLDAGFSNEQITVVCSDETKERYFSEFEHQHPAGTYTPTATIAGGTIGALLGGLTIVASAIATGSLALWAAGPITAWAGGVAGGLVGAMMTRGVEKELANFYQQAVVAGQILVAAEDHGPDSTQNLAKAAQILAEAGAKPLLLPEG
jgi:heat induced stress protein YflT